MEAPFHWDWHPHPDVWLVVGGIYAWYRWSLYRAEKKLDRPVASKKQRVLFTTGCVILFVASEWPVHDLAEGYLYSVHMLQHLLFTLVAAPFMLSGTPPELFRKLTPGPIMSLVRKLAKPFFALVVANAVLIFVHWPPLVNASISSEPLHFALHVLILLAAFVMWMPVLSPVLEVPKLSKPAQAGYLFLQSLLPTVPASFMTFGSAPLYDAYNAFPHPFGVSTLSDQRTAGLIMKLMGGVILWSVMTAIFFSWFSYESRHDVDVLSHSGTDRDLDRMELRS